MGMDYRTEMEELGLQTDDVDLHREDEEATNTNNQHTNQQLGATPDSLSPVERGRRAPRASPGNLEPLGATPDGLSPVERGRRAPRASPGNLEPDKIPCKICGDSAVRHIHYGGHCCFSCKAFFRRAVHHQNKTGRSFKCKFEGTCEINIRNRKTCQSCRFQKCCDTGMNPSWVLSDDQRKKRFKKYRENGPSSGHDSVSSPDSASTELDLDHTQHSHLPTLHERNTTRRRVKSAPDRASGSMVETPRGRGAGRKYSSRQGMNKGHGLNLHCGASTGSNNSASTSQPVSPVDSICSIDFSQTWAFPDVVKSEPEDSSSYLDSMQHDIQEPQYINHLHQHSGHQQHHATTSPVKLEPDGCPAFMYNHHERQTSVETTNSIDYDPLTVKEELEVDPEQVDKLQDLINSVDFATIKTINEIVDNAEANSVKHVYQHQPESGYQSDFYPVTPEADPLLPPNFGMAAMAPVHQNGNRSDLSDDDPLAVIKLEMAFLNSNQSFPRMSEETKLIWNEVVASCNFSMLNNGSAASNILNEAVELALKRNLIFLEENPDFTALSLELRTQLYINNMGKMCHVRGLLHHIGGNRFQQAAQNGTNITPYVHMGTNFMWTSHADNSLQMVYKDPRTGKLRNFMGRQPGACGGNLPICAKDDQDTLLLALAEEISELKLNVVPITIILLMVLFHCDNSGTPNDRILNALQNKYVNMLYRYIQSNYEEDQAKKCIHVLFKFIVCLMGKSN